MNIRNILPWVSIVAALITVYLNWVQTKEILKLKKLATGEALPEPLPVGSSGGGCGCGGGSHVTDPYKAQPIF